MLESKEKYNAVEEFVDTVSWTTRRRRKGRTVRDTTSGTARASHIDMVVKPCSVCAEGGIMKGRAFNYM